MVRDQLAALNRLQHGVVDVTRDPGALRQPLVEARRHGPGNLQYSQAIERRCREHEPDGQRREKRSRLKPRRLDAEVQRRSGLVPHASVVAGSNAEAILARTKIVVQRLAAIAGVMPVSVVSFELVAKPHVPRELEAQRGVGDFELLSERRQTRWSI